MPRRAARGNCRGQGIGGISMWEKGLEIASRITHPVSLAAISVIISAYLFRLALNSKRRRAERMLYVGLGVVTLVGLAPLLAKTYLESQSLYRIRVQVLGLDGQPVSEAWLE